jgi:hypothetical protein
MQTEKFFRACLLACTASSLMLLNAAHAAPDAAVQTRVEAIAKNIAIELATVCPVSDTASPTAYDTCRKALYNQSELKRVLPDFVLWGRQKDPKKLLKDSNLTQFAPDVLSSMYLPLFMFNGKYTVGYVEAEGVYQIRLQTAFRNRLSPGEYPYPFWHEDEKWTMYEKANEVLLFWDADKNRIKVAQFTVFGATPPITEVSHLDRPKFDGQWLWTDANGNTQPKITVFDGLFKADNPYIAKVEGAYKSFALRMRDGQCNKCHVPNNPDHMKKLVLLQTPMHAAAEIKRVLKSIREDRMPIDEFGVEDHLDNATKDALLNEGAAFDKLLDEAKLWESVQRVANTKTTISSLSSIKAK